MTARRAYHSPMRTDAADRTRAQILLAATSLFAERGFGRVTVADIASAAGCSAKTVFSSVGSKGEVLRQIAVAAVDASGHRATVAAAYSLPTTEAVVATLAHGTRVGNQEQFLATEVILKAMPVHDEAEQLWATMTFEYRRALADVAQHLVHLDPELERGPVADLFWFCFGPTAWRTLVVENGMDWGDAEQILKDAAHGTLWPTDRGVRPRMHRARP